MLLVVTERKGGRLASGASDRKVVEVQVLFWAPPQLIVFYIINIFLSLKKLDKTTLSLFFEVSSQLSVNFQALRL